MKTTMASYDFDTKGAHVLNFKIFPLRIKNHNQTCIDQPCFTVFQFWK